MIDATNEAASGESISDAGLAAYRERVMRKAAEARAKAYSAEITRLESEVIHYKSLYMDQQNELCDLRGELMAKLGSTGG